MLTIKSSCSHCHEAFTWTSQPYMLGKFPAGNLLLSFAILCSGVLVLQNMGVLICHYPTYFYHQRHFLVPAIVKYWRGYQAELLRKLSGKEVVVAGDGRHDSMGHSAKYGTYTIFCCTIGCIIHIVLVQVIILSLHICIQFYYKATIECHKTKNKVITLANHNYWQNIVQNQSIFKAMTCSQHWVWKNAYSIVTAFYCFWSSGKPGRKQFSHGVHGLPTGISIPPWHKNAR